MVAEDVTDLPAKTVARTIRNQHPDTVVLTFLGPPTTATSSSSRPAARGRSSSRSTMRSKLIARLDELAEAWRAKARERRYTQAFRERHYDFLRRYVEIKTKIERAMNEGPG